MNTNVKVIGLTRLGIKPKSTVAPEADALTTRPSELLEINLIYYWWSCRNQKNAAATKLTLQAHIKTGFSDGHNFIPSRKIKEVT